MKKFLKLLFVLFMFVPVLIGLVGCEFSIGSNPNNDPTNEVADQSLSYVGLRINPEIELVVDDDGNVVSVNAINEDGETVLCQIELVGLTVEEAAELFTSMAVELGFIDVDAQNATVYILADGLDEEFVAEIEANITIKINDFFTEKGIFGKATKEDLEELKDLAEEWKVSLKDAKLINRILELYPEMTLEEVQDLSFEEMMELVKNDAKEHGLPVSLKEEYKEEVEAIKAEYEYLFTLRKELEELEIKLSNPELNDEEKEALQAEYDAKELEYKALHEEYKEEIKAIRDAKKEEVKAVKDAIKNHADELREMFEQKNKEHEQKIKDELDQIKDEIDKWREGFKDVFEDKDHNHDDSKNDEKPEDSNEEVTESETEEVKDETNIAE